MRHGIAEDGGPSKPDADRALTAEGRKKLRQVLQLATEVGADPSLILTSVLKRAAQTAEIARDVFKHDKEAVPSGALALGAPVEQVWDEVRAHRDERAILLVGHNPQFSELAAYLLGSRELQVDLKKGSLFRVDIEGFSARPHGVLRWYLTAKLAVRHN